MFIGFTSVCSRSQCSRTSAGECFSYDCQFGAASLPQPVIHMAQPFGCICPPTSEQTCLNQICPRGGATNKSQLSDAYYRTEQLRQVLEDIADMDDIAEIHKKCSEALLRPRT
jgi:hypothetical protein